jgi:hypothetical protein
VAGASSLSDFSGLGNAIGAAKPQAKVSNAPQRAQRAQSEKVAIAGIHLALIRVAFALPFLWLFVFLVASCGLCSVGGFDIMDADAGSDMSETS